jgi:hypothetical protein
MHVINPFASIEVIAEQMANPILHARKHIMNICATPIRGRDLRPGDLFSTAGPEYWDDFVNFASIGELVYIRTCAPTDRAPDGGEMVFKIEIRGPQC